MYADDLAGLLRREAHLHQRLRHGVVDDLDHAAADKPLVLDEREVGLDAGRVAIHHEADGAGRSEHGDLRILVAELFAEIERVVPGILRRGVQFRLNIFGLDAANRVAVHANDVEHRLAVDGIARERSLALGDARRLRVGLAAHQRGDGAGNVAAFVGVIRQRHRHQQRAEIGVAEARAGGNRANFRRFSAWDSSRYRPESPAP